MKLKTILPVEIFLSWLCTIVIIILEYRYTLKLNCHEFGCETDWGILMFGVPAFVVQLFILTPFALSEIWSKKNRIKNKSTTISIFFRSFFSVLPVIISFTIHLITGIYVRQQLQL